MVLLVAMGNHRARSIPFIGTGECRRPFRSLMRFVEVTQGRIQSPINFIARITSPGSRAERNSERISVVWNAVAICL